MASLAYYFCHFVFLVCLFSAHTQSLLRSHVCGGKEMLFVFVTCVLKINIEWKRISRQQCQNSRFSMIFCFPALWIHTVLITLCPNKRLKMSKRSCSSTFQQACYPPKMAEIFCVELFELEWIVKRKSIQQNYISEWQLMELALWWQFSWIIIWIDIYR